MITRKDEIQGFLEQGDEVIFQVNGKALKYRVSVNHLFCTNDHNDAIFRELGLNEDAFCERHYGYPSDGTGIWPYCEAKDFPALTRVVKALYDEIEKRKEKTIDAKKALIRFMELKQAALGPDYNYFTFEDAQAMMEWPESECQEVLYKLETKGKEKGLYTISCPFCIYHGVFETGEPNCSICSYGKRHGECEQTRENDWEKIPRKVRENFNWKPLLEKATSHPKTTWIKPWEDRQEDDAEDQIYFKLVQTSKTMITLYTADKNGCRIKGVISINPEGLYRQLSSETNSFYPVDEEGRISIIKEDS